MTDLIIIIATLVAATAFSYFNVTKRTDPEKQADSSCGSCGAEKFGADSVIRPVMREQKHPIAVRPVRPC